MEIGDRDQLDPVRLHLGRELWQVGEGLGVGGERAVAILIADVEPDHVGRHAVAAQARGDLANLVGAAIAVARLLVAKRPFRRERGVAGQVGVAPGDLHHRRPGDEVIVDRAVGAAERQRLGIAVTEVEPGAVGVVEQDAVAASRAAGADEEGYRLVDRIVSTAEPERVGVPVDEAVPAPVEPLRLVTQAVEMLRDRQRLGDRERLAVGRDGRGVGGDDLAVERLEGDRAAGIDADADAGGGEAVGGGGDGDLLVADRGGDGPAGILREQAVLVDAHANQTIGHRGDPRGGRADMDVDTVAPWSQCGRGDGGRCGHLRVDGGAAHAGGGGEQEG